MTYLRDERSARLGDARSRVSTKHIDFELVLINIKDIMDSKKESLAHSLLDNGGQ